MTDPTTAPHKIYLSLRLLCSINLITVVLKPSLFAASKSFRCVDYISPLLPSRYRVVRQAPSTRFDPSRCIGRYCFRPRSDGPHDQDPFLGSRSSSRRWASTGSCSIVPIGPVVVCGCSTSARVYFRVVIWFRYRDGLFLCCYVLPQMNHTATWACRNTPPLFPSCGQPPLVYWAHLVPVLFFRGDPISWIGTRGRSGRSRWCALRLFLVVLLVGVWLRPSKLELMTFLWPISDE